MSDLENALTGAEAAPAPEEIAQELPQNPAPAETDEQLNERERDEKGRFAPVQKRINELTRQRHEAQRYAEQEAARASQLAAELERYRNPPPSIEDDPQGFVQHLAREETRRLLDSERSQWAQHHEQQRMAQMAAEFSQRAQSFAAQTPDFDEAIRSADQIIGDNPALIEVLATSDLGPQVAHYLGTHLDEAVKVSQMSPHLAAAHVARLEARLSAPKVKPVTHAPAPAPTVGGGSALPGIRDGMDYEAYRAARMRG